MTFTNTIGTVRVAWSNGATVECGVGCSCLRFPFACLAVLSLVALLGVETVGGTLQNDRYGDVGPRARRTES